eukprot:1915096-Pyramimonas_sp.AAC.1
MAGVVSRAPAAKRRVTTGIATRNVAQRIEAVPVMHLGRPDLRVRGAVPLEDGQPPQAAGSGPSEQAILARPPAMRAVPRGGSRRSR